MCVKRIAAWTTCQGSPVVTIHMWGCITYHRRLTAMMGRDGNFHTPMDPLSVHRLHSRRVGIKQRSHLRTHSRTGIIHVTFCFLFILKVVNLKRSVLSHVFTNCLKSESVQDHLYDTITTVLLHYVQHSVRISCCIVMPSLRSRYDMPASTKLPGAASLGIVRRTMQTQVEPASNTGHINVAGGPRILSFRLHAQAAFSSS